MQRFNATMDDLFKFYPTIVARLEPLTSIIDPSIGDKNHHDKLVHDIASKSVFANKGWVYFGCLGEYEVSPIESIFGFGKVNRCFGAMNMANGVNYTRGMEVTLSLHHQRPRGLFNDSEDIKWTILDVYWGKGQGKGRAKYEPWLCVFNKEKSKYDFQYKETEVTTPKGLIKKKEKIIGLPDVPVREYPRWKFVPVSQVKYNSSRTAHLLNPDENVIQQIANKGYERDPKDPRGPIVEEDEKEPKEPSTMAAKKKRKKPKTKVKTEDTDSEPEIIEQKRPKTSTVAGPSTDELMGQVGKLQREKADLVKACETHKSSRELAEAKAKDLEEENAKMVTFKRDVLNVYMTKFEEQDPKTQKAKPFKEYVPRALRTYFTHTELAANFDE